MHSPLESLQHWYHLPGVAEATPREFLREGWDWLVQVCERFHRGPASTVLNHYVGYCLAMDEERDRPEPSILSAFWAAIDLIADGHSEEFVEITKGSWTSESAVLHLLIIRGLLLVAKHNPHLSLDYLIGDDRRFGLGGHSGRNQTESIKLIAELAQRLDREDLQRLYERILVYSQYRKDADLITKQTDWDRETRLRLLDAIPKSVRTPDMDTFIEKEKKLFPEWHEITSHRPKSGFVHRVPPITKDSMLVASDKEILSAINKSNAASQDQSLRRDVEGGWEEPGGPETVALEVAEMAKDNPKRACEITLLLIQQHKEDLAANALRGLADTNLTDDEIYDFVRKATAPGAAISEELRSSLSCVLYKRSHSPQGLPDDLCKLIREWLAQPWNSKYRVFAESNSKEATDRIEALLWTSSGGMVDTDQSFWSLLAITQAYLSREPIAADLWLDVLEESLSYDISDRTWAAFAFELKWLRLKACNHRRAEAFVSKLFNKYPSLPKQREAMVLVSHISDVVTSNFLKQYLTNLRDSDNRKMKQGYGELLPLIALRDHKHKWATKVFNAELNRIARGLSEEPIAVGLAFTAAQIWDNPNLRLDASKILCALVPNATENVREAIHTVFWAEQDFANEESTILLLKSLAQSPPIFAGMRIYDLAEHLVGLVVYQPKLILDVCNAILASGRKEHELFEIGPQLVKIAMTLQRIGETREGGLTLLENLLRLGLDDAFAVLVDIDIRPSASIRSLPRQRRRRVRKGRRAKSA